MTTNEKLQAEFEAREKAYIKQIKALMARNKELQDQIALHAEIRCNCDDDYGGLIKHFRED